MTEETEAPWHRLTKVEATNFLITALILMGHDPNKELVIDGDPGPYLLKAAKELDSPPDFGKFDERSHAIYKGPAMPLTRMAAVWKILDIAKLIGYEGKTIAGFIEYLQSLPETGTIGTNL